MTTETGLPLLQAIRQLTPAQDAAAGQRAQAMASLQDVGLPRRGLETWKYSPVQLWQDVEWTPSLHFSPPALTAEQKAEIQTQLAPGMTHLVFVNGHFQKELSSPLPPGLKVVTGTGEPTDYALAARQGWQQQQQVQEWWKNSYSLHETSMGLLNMAGYGQGAVLEVAPETLIAQPVALHFQSGAGQLVQPRLQISVGAGSSVSFLENYFGSSSSMTNVATHLQLADSAKVQCLRWMQAGKSSFHYGESIAVLAANSHLQSLSMQTGGRWSRHFLSVFHQGPDSFSKIDGIYWARGEQQIENYTNIEHLVGRCQSEQVYKGILADKSRGVFAGRVHIGKGAALASSSQLNQTLLMSSDAEMDSKPQLEIDADDVKATHGSTVGQLSAEEVFYLQSRAIDAVTAKQILAEGFVTGLLTEFPQATLRQWALQRFV